MRDKNILITGGTGTLGKALLKAILEEEEPQSVRVFSRSEYRQHLAKKEFDDKRIRWFIGDIRDKQRLFMACRHVDIIINCAAKKRVESSHDDPIECKKTNIDGVDNIIHGAMIHNVSRIFQVSTDKAVYPTTLYGKTKAVAEDLIINANHYSTAVYPMFSVGRFGNFVGSSGNVEEIFKKLAEEGKPLPVTDQMMRRYFIYPQLAANFIIKWIKIMAGGEIFIPCMTQINIMDVAKRYSSDIKIVGLREREKLSEDLFSVEEKPHLKDMGDYLCISSPTLG